MASVIENICFILAAIICWPFVCILCICGCGHLFKEDDDFGTERVIVAGNVNRAAVIPERPVIPERQVGTGKSLELPYR